MSDLEKLGVFYLGRSADGPVLYESRDLVTHAVCVGMTGSGKTGLVIAMLEEAGIDGVPALVVDPKGDLANLLLTFPALRAEDFAPWVAEDDARREGIAVGALAAREAERWRRGLADWEQDGGRIARFRDAVDVAVYTPGSSAGLPVSLLRSFAAPPAALRHDPDALRERVTTTAASVLALAGLEGDPLQSRDHILVATLLERAWRAGRDLDLAGLVREVYSPGLDRVGVLDLEEFHPARERGVLAARLNNLLAAPGSGAWMEGDPLDVPSLLWTPAGRPRIAIFSIAHLGDAERAFFVTLLLGELLAWMRTQPGTSSLRAILAIDEMAGFLPPVAMPPTKPPLLTLLKQARAYGVGLVLATQNPVDLDYKGLGNAGTWLIGRLQTERDRGRLLDGLAGSGGGRIDRGTAERLVTGLEKRQFLLHDVHEEAPIVFTSRWTLSYLRGPLTRAQLETLTAPRRAAAARTPFAPASAVAGGDRPVVPPRVVERFLAPAGAPPAGGRLVYRPALLGTATVHLADPKRGIAHVRRCVRLLALDADAPSWSDATAVEDRVLAPDPAPEARFAPLPPAAARAASYDAWRKQLVDHLGRTERLTLHEALGLHSRPDETERDFRVRLRQAAREERDRRVDAVRARLAPRRAALEERLRRAEHAVAREAGQVSQRRLETAVSVGSAMLGALFGRRSAVGGASTAARSLGRTMRERDDVVRAEENLAAVRERLAALDADAAAEVQALEMAVEPGTVPVETVVVRPRRGDVSVEGVALLWLPYWQRPDGTVLPAARERGGAGAHPPEP